MYNRMYVQILFGAYRCLVVARKKNLTGISTGLTGRSKNLDPNGFHLCYEIFSFCSMPALLPFLLSFVGRVTSQLACIFIRLHFFIV